MKQLTLRGFDAELESRLRELARARATSLNRAALELMRRGAGLESAVPTTRELSPIGTALDKFIGVWTMNDEEELLRSIASFERADPELWT